MKLLKLNKSLRRAIIFVNALILLIWSGFVFFWYMVITSDIPPAPTVEELLTLNKLVGFWFLILIENGLFLKLTTNRATP